MLEFVQTRDAMTLSLQLPQHLEAELSAEAARHGLTLPDYALQILATGSRPAKSELERKPRTGAELVEYWQREGLIGPAPAVNNAPEDARALREKAQNRRWAE
ncbi:hypothetical protein [Anatilimnocola floriformis]|uniref:hypothetical protein n=1 Tax=Anatilimnocola floriformis TaxID=2948575 RepID=UPI0020C49B76|nr:hypothetical protein [Anatilimnocola floriformis]